MHEQTQKKGKKKSIMKEYNVTFSAYLYHSKHRFPSWTRKAKPVQGFFKMQNAT